jgi:hypothetical protein
MDREFDLREDFARILEGCCPKKSAISSLMLRASVNRSNLSSIMKKRTRSHVELSLKPDPP